jgi:3-oxoacyl-[acyl-carrier-protein] synthase III
VLLSRSEDGDQGFSRFGSSTFPEHAGAFTSEVSWKPGRIPRAVAARMPWLERGHNVLRIHQDDGFAARCVECATTATSAFLKSVGLAPMDIDLLVPSPSPAGFPDGLGRSLGVPVDRMARIDDGLGGVHTAGPIAALDGAMRKGRFDAANNVLFVAVGAGITVSLALYHP